MVRRKEELQVTVVPSHFRCPISLDVMKSPVSLCTGITYDRSSIQRWLEAGNNTCPATMQVLPSTDLVPNHTLHRLIQLWWKSSTHHYHPKQQHHSEEESSSSNNNNHNSNSNVPPPRPSQLLRQIHASPNNEDPLPFLHLLCSFPPSELAANPSAIPILTAVLRRHPHDEHNHLAVKSAVVRVLALLLPIADSAALKPTADTTALSAIVSVLTASSSSTDVGTRADAARVLASIAAVDAGGSRVATIAGAIAGMARLLVETEEVAIDAGLSCLVEVSTARSGRARAEVAGVAGDVGRALGRTSVATSSSSAEKAMRLLEGAATCAEGRAAICEDARGVIGAVVERMVRLSREGRERALLLLWSVCHLYRDRRALDAAVAEGNGPITRILLLVLMQSDCSPAARRMASDLLRIFCKAYPNNTSSSSSSSCLSISLSNTPHIMPF